MHEAPLVSVLTPVYNNAPFLAACIESVLTQTYGNYEYLIVNNCSTDHTLDVAQSYARNDSRIRVHNNEAFLGVIDNHNLAFSLMSSTSKYCKVVSGDDFIFPECLMQMVGFAEAHPSVGLVGSYSLAGRGITCVGLEYEKKVVSGREICRDTLLGGPYLFGSPTSLLYRADLVRKSKAFYPDSSPHADTTACYQSLETCDFGFVHQILSYSRIHPDSQTSRSFKFGTINRALIADLTRFGPTYLTREELEERFELLMDLYYGWLAPALLAHARDKEFWRVQKAGLQGIGQQLSSIRLVKAALRKGIGVVLKPRAALEKISTIRRKDAKQIEAKYYK